MAPGLITSWQIDGETTETVRDFIFLGSKSLQMVTAAMKLIRSLVSSRFYDKPRKHLKQIHYFANKGP